MNIMTYWTTGVATSMLFSAFESWYVYEHTERKCFSAEWISATFSFTTLGNGLLAIASGVISNFVAGGKKFSYFGAVGFSKISGASIPKHQSVLWHKIWMSTNLLVYWSKFDHVARPQKTTTWQIVSASFDARFRFQFWDCPSLKLDSESGSETEHA